MIGGASGTQPGSGCFLGAPGGFDFVITDLPLLLSKITGDVMFPPSEAQFVVNYGPNMYVQFASDVTTVTIGAPPNGLQDTNGKDVCGGTFPITPV